MNKILKLKEIAQSLQMGDIICELEGIEKRSQQENPQLILPLVGEFSSGKTTLINSLTDSKKLETATKPTTATIYEVHFGCDSCHATIINEDGKSIEFTNIEALKNDTLSNAKVVTVFDTSNKIPATTILVDTPGLSSPDLQHKQTLINFLPKADAVLLVIDINQQITRSLTDFIDTIKLSLRPLYLVLTKADTKAKQDIEDVKKYICENCKIPIQEVVVVAAAKDELDEFYELLNRIEKDKKKIIENINEQRVRNIINRLKEHAESMMQASTSDKEMDEAIRRCQYDLDKINRNISKLVDTTAGDIEEEERKTCRKFEDCMEVKLESIITGKSNNIDAEAHSAIQSTSFLLLNEYKKNVKQLLYQKAQSSKNTDDEIPVSSLAALDISAYQLSELNYELDLNSLGHEYDGMIKNGVIAVGVVAAVAAVAASGGSAAAPMAGMAIDAADAITDVGSMLSNQKAVGRLEKTANLVMNAAEKYQDISNKSQYVSQAIGSEKDLLTSLVAMATEKTMSKPKRRHAIRNYLDESLIPEFKFNMQAISQKITKDICDTLQKAAENITEQKKEALQQLKKEKQEKQEVFVQRMKQLTEYRNTLLTF